MMFLALKNPIVLFALPLVLLPFFTSIFVPKNYSWTGLIPNDPFSHYLKLGLKLFACLALFFLLVGIAGLYITEQHVTRIGKGAHIILLLDRSASMDHTFAGKAPSGDEESKSAAAKRILDEFVRKRKKDLFGVAAFSTSSIFVLPLSAHKEATLAAIAVTDRPGLAFTNVAKGLAMALSYFEGKPHTGSRVVLLVSDGATVIDFRAQRKLRKWFEKFRVNLYWIFIRTESNRGIYDQPTDQENDRPEIMPERHLHKFFSSLRTPYKAFQADNPDELANALKDIDRLENLPLRYQERIPRKNLSWICYLLAGLMILILLVVKLLEVPQGQLFASGLPEEKAKK